MWSPDGDHHHGSREDHRFREPDIHVRGGRGDTLPRTVEATDPARHDNISDWKPGSAWTHKRTDPAGTVDIVGEVVESDRPRRLVLTWAQPKEAGNPGKTSRVTFELAPEDWPGGPWVRLSMAHTELEPDSEMFHSVSYGWPALMSGLKTLLERRSFAKG